ncbi:chorismate synthase [Candidatus Vidania fulgoroideorum]
MNNSIGDIFKVTTFGESHGVSIGCILEGCPAGFLLKKKYIKNEINKRKTGTSKYVTQRKEIDNIEIHSGIFNKRTTGTPIGIIVKNIDTISKDYSNIKNLFRPGHADFTYYNKYGIRDYRGGGRSSARTTISLVIAGSIAKKILLKFFNIKIFCYINKINKINIKFINKKFISIKNFFSPNLTILNKVKSFLTNIIKKNNSTGCSLSISVNGVISGLGDPLYEKLDSNISKQIMNLNAVKAIEIGSGKNVETKMGSQNNDVFYKEGIIKNDSGGFLGGITTGQDIKIIVSIKPTSSIFLKQKTIKKNNQEKKIKIKGRHDPCVGIRAVPILESIIAIVLINSIMKQKIINFF